MTFELSLFKEYCNMLEGACYIKNITLGKFISAKQGSGPEPTIP